MECLQAKVEVKQDGQRESSEGKPRYDLVPIWFYDFLADKVGSQVFMLEYDLCSMFRKAKSFESEYITSQNNPKELETAFHRIFNSVFDKTRPISFSPFCFELYDVAGDQRNAKAISIYHTVSEALGHNSYKYGDWNWAKGIPTREHMASFCRHCVKMTVGETDEDHYSHAMANLFFMLYNLKTWQSFDVGINEKPKIECDGVDVSEKWSYENMIKIQAPFICKVDN